MYSDYIKPPVEGFTGKVLDVYLAAGYYRMRHDLFTTHYIPRFDEENSLVIMPVFWLRTLVNKITENKSAFRIRKQCAAFTVEYITASITEEIEELYTTYHSKIEFDAAEKCRDYLEDPIKANPFDSRMIVIRDGRKLIAVGYFDLGQEAMMGILNFYHPDYRKYSLGKYLMLKKIDFAKQHGVQYYYTGYLGTTETKFDYKLFPDKKAMEVLLAFDQEWVPWGKFDKAWLHGYFMDQVLGDSN